MLAYVTLGSNDKDKAVEFYDAVMGELGGQRVFANDRLQFYGTGLGQLMMAKRRRSETASCQRLAARIMRPSTAPTRKR